MVAGNVLATEYYPPPGDNKGVIGGSSGQAWQEGISQTITVDNYAAGAVSPTETVTAANTITASECGTTYYLSAATEFASALPAMSTVDSGCDFTFVIKAAASGCIAVD